MTTSLGRTRTARRTRISAFLWAASLAAHLAALPSGAVADITSDHPAAILVFPKIIVDTASGLDTMVRITNVSTTAINVFCFYVNATPSCPLGLPDATSCFPNKQTCFGTLGEDQHSAFCQPKWQETDFLIRLTQNQPTGWLVSRGERATNCDRLDGVCSNDGTTLCDEDTPCLVPGSRCVRPACLPLADGRVGPTNEFNTGAIPVSPEDPFIGELKCIALDDGQRPVARNDLIGEALIGKVQAGPDKSIDVAGYNAIGIPAIKNECLLPAGICSLSATPCTGPLECEATNNRDYTLVLGGPAASAEYEGCPNILIVDHYFDGAADTLVRNFCRADGTCNVSGIDCASDSECIENICRDNACTITETACTDNGDCVNECVDDPVQCPPNGSCCTLSGESCRENDDCTEPDFQTRVVTEVTMVPCTEDFENQETAPYRTTAQFLVFNEFEQRFSASISVECFREIRLSDITSPGQNHRSIFSAGVSGTLTGQTRIRGGEGTGTGSRPAGFALLGVMEEFRCSGAEFDFPLCNYVDSDRMVSGVAKNVHIQGRRPDSDFIYLPQQ